MCYLDRYDVFRVARQLCEGTDELVAAFERGHASLRDQIRRSTQSVLLNIAEGLGRIAPGEKRRAYAIARGEVHELRAALVITSLRGLLNASGLAELDTLADRVGALLWKLIQRFRE